jgi:hypothetical protein
MSRLYRLHWEGLQEVLGGDQGIAKVLDALRNTSDVELREIIELAKRYLSGWRPAQFGDD